MPATATKISVTVKFFASLKEHLGRSEVSLELDDADRRLTVLDVWKAASGTDEMPANALAAVNLEYVPPGYAIQDGDEVAFFPPVTGG